MEKIVHAINKLKEFGRLIRRPEELRWRKTRPDAAAQNLGVAMKETGNNRFNTID